MNLANTIPADPAKAPSNEAMALIVLKHRPGEAHGSFEVPTAVPVGGIVVSGLLLAHAKLPELKLALILLVGIAALYLIVRPKAVTEDTFVFEEGEG